MSTHVTRRGSIPAAMGWMISLSILLFWMPFFGGLVAGFVGGRRAGGIGPAVVAAVLPGVILFLVSFFLGGLLGWIPIIGQLIGLLLGTGAFALSFMNVIPLLIGAVVGGATVDR